MGEINRFDFRRCTDCGEVLEDVPRRDVRAPQIEIEYVCFSCQMKNRKASLMTNDVLVSKLNRIAVSLELIASYIDPEYEAKHAAKEHLAAKISSAGEALLARAQQPFDPANCEPKPPKPE